MNGLESFSAGLIENWQYWLVSIVLVIAAVIDGIQLKVPNWITFPLIMTGWVYSAIAFGLTGEGWYVGLAWSLVGTAVGLFLLLPAYAVGGMGAGDVKLLAGVGAWVYGWTTFYAFCLSAIVGAVLAIMMVVAKGGIQKHTNQFRAILNEFAVIRDPEQLSAIAADRKSSMLLLPYGIPIAIGTIFYFAWMGLLV